MRLLAIDCSTEACSAALFEHGGLLDARHELIGRGHAERLVPMIAELPSNGCADRVLVSLGPGSFTGTRIGLAAGRALGVAWRAQVQGFPTFSLLAAMARAEVGAREGLVAMAGGHGEYFVQPFGKGGLSVGEVLSLEPEDAVRRFSHEIVVGNRAEEFVSERGFGVPVPLLPDARHALAIPDDMLTDSLVPIYGRPPDARLPS